MTSHVKCAVINCTSKLKTISYYRFPHPRKDFDNFLNWVKATGNPKLQSPLVVDIYNKYRICDKHFSPEDFIGNKRIRKDIVPTQLLPVPLHLDLGIDTVATDTVTDITPPQSFDAAEEPTLVSFMQAMVKSPKKRKYTDDAEPGTSEIKVELDISQVPVHLDSGVDIVATDTTPPQSFDAAEPVLVSFMQAMVRSPKKRKYTDDAEPGTSEIKVELDISQAAVVHPKYEYE